MRIDQHLVTMLIKEVNEHIDILERELIQAVNDLTATDKTDKIAKLEARNKVQVIIRRYADTMQLRNTLKDHEHLQF